MKRLIVLIVLVAAACVAVPRKPAPAADVCRVCIDKNGGPDLTICEPPAVLKQLKDLGLDGCIQQGQCYYHCGH